MTDKNWLEDKIEFLSGIEGYKTPDIVEGSVKLDSNENYSIPKQFQNEIIQSARKRSDVREYPLGGTRHLIRAISEYVGVPPSMIGVGNGSDQILDILLANFASCNTSVLVSNPTFEFFELRCKLYSVPTISVPFTSGMILDPDDFVKKFSFADILYLDTPNNPTGFQFPKNLMYKLIKSFEGLVIVDEAYGEFSDYSVAGLTRRQKNLIVVRTLSKSFGLAGLRLGYMVANKNLTLFSLMFQYPYPLSSITIEAGIEAMSRIGTVNNTIEKIKAERDRVTTTLGKYESFTVFESNANFVLFDAGSAYKRIHSALLEQGISIRRLGNVGGYEGCLRVTVGTKEMNSKFLLAVRDLLR